MSFKGAFVFVIVAIAVAYYGGDYIKSHHIVTTYFPKFIKLIPGFSNKQKDSSDEVDKLKETAEAERLFTKEELWKDYRGGEDSKGLYLAIMGKVYDVSKGAKHYGPGGGYEFFAGRDGTKAYSTGEFNEAGLVDDLAGVPLERYPDYESWLEFYDKDYTYVGKVIGNFYDEKGNPTAALKEANNMFEEARKQKAIEDEKNKKLPRCNSEWTKEKGSRVWCTTKSGGVQRDWVGVPRRLHEPGSKASPCVCIRNTGPPTLEHSKANENRGDLDYPYLKEYENCNPKSASCKI